jgi:hypothetical protein
MLRTTFYTKIVEIRIIGSLKNYIIVIFTIYGLYTRHSKVGRNIQLLFAVFVIARFFILTPSKHII